MRKSEGTYYHAVGSTTVTAIVAVFVVSNVDLIVIVAVPVATAVIVPVASTVATVGADDAYLQDCGAKPVVVTVTIGVI